MKTLILTLSLAVAGVSTANAQLYSPTVTRTAVLGSVAGALIGGHNNDHWGEGAIIGAAVGALFGAAIDQPPSRTVAYCPPPVVQAAPYVADCAPAQVVYVNNPPVRYVTVAPAPRVVYVNGYAPNCAPYYAPRAPVVVINRPNPHRRPQTVVYVRPRGRGRD